VSRHGSTTESAVVASDLPFLSIEEAAPLLRTRQLSPLELTRAVLERIDRLEPSVHAYITVTADWALHRAALAEQEIVAGRYRGPLHGIPLGLKDLIATAGVRTTAGSRVLAHSIPTAHAPVVARLLAAGAIIVGKHALQEFAFGGTGANPFFGTPRNPWNPDHVPGGSSGGTAAAIAAGLCLGGVGSDTTGSIRIPASYCGLSGLKPTYGRISLRGVIPLAWSLDHLGPMARSARDCALLLNALAGDDSADPASSAMPPEDATAGIDQGVAGLRIGVVREYLDDPHLDPQVGAAVDAALAVLGAHGAQLLPVRLPDLDPVRRTWCTIFNAEAAAIHAGWLETSSQLYSAGLAHYLRAAADERAPALAAAYRVRAASVRAADALMTGYDVLVGPTTPYPAPPIAAPAADPAASQFALGALRFQQPRAAHRLDDYRQTVG
jgi:aspartyl-tRNA(Asn)/glutamyl-tRNA(Gln) amidotransferase subunit A